MNKKYSINIKKVRFMRNKKKLRILTGLVCVAVIVIFSILVYSQINQKQGVTSAVPSSKTTELLTTPSSPNDTDLSANNNIEKNQNQADARQEAASNQIQTQEETSAIPSDAQLIYDILKLRRQSSKEAVEKLTVFLDHDSPAVVSEAIDALCYYAVQNGSTEMVFDILKQKAADKFYPQRGDVLVAAAKLKIDDQLLNILPGFLIEKGEQGEEDMFNAVRALSFVESPEVVPYLNQIIDRSTSPKTQRTAYNLLAKVDSTESSEFLESKLGSSEGLQKKNATWALSRSNSPGYNQILENAVINSQLDDESMAVLASSPSAPQVFGNLLTNDTIEKEKKLIYMKSIAENAASATTAIRRDMEDVLAPLLDSQDKDLEIEAIKALGKVGAGSPDMAELLEPKLQSPDAEVREQAFGSYLSSLSAKTYKPLLDLLGDDNENIRRSAMVFAGHFVDSSDKEQLTNALDNEDEYIREQAKKMLEKL